jgi:hypothetical protein|tara:strand:+ start:263 stop:415 length:153 start_codon:yes stop_codon:yes gene_type:complete
VEALLASLETLKDDVSPKAYKCELLMCFWFSLHTGVYLIAQKLYDEDVII